MVATFNGKPSTMIIFCYSPTNASDETDLDTFYKPSINYYNSQCLCTLTIYIYSKLIDCDQKWSEDSYFKSYYTEE